MSFVYPIARGSAPVLVLVAGAIVLGATVSLPAAVGVVVVAAGIVLVRGVQRGRAPAGSRARPVGRRVHRRLHARRQARHRPRRADLLPRVGARRARVIYVLAVWRVRGGAALRAAVSRTTLLAGVGIFGAYALALAALRLAPAASVSAVRESSVVMATAVLAITGRERIGPGRLIGAVAVVAGIALISLG